MDGGLVADPFCDEQRQAVCGAGADGGCLQILFEQDYSLPITELVSDLVRNVSSALKSTTAHVEVAALRPPS